MMEYRIEPRAAKLGTVATVAQWWSRRFVILHGQRMPALAVVFQRLRRDERLLALIHDEVLAPPLAS